MKVTIQFKNDNCSDLNENLDIEIENDVMEQLEKAAKKEGVCLDEIIRRYLTAIMRQIELEEMNEQEIIAESNS